MASMDHWHPVLLGKALRRKPVGVRLNGHDIVLFRSGPGQVGALEDCCPHRRMRLSMGKVVGTRLQCPYHGWTFDRAGEGESPGTPKLHACAGRYEAVERNGVVWVKSAASNPVFPAFEVDGFLHACTMEHRIRAPLEVTLDNFTEIEHTPTTHGVFGYELERMQEVSVRFEQTETTTRVINAGPQKPLPFWIRALLGVGRHYHFNDDWTTYFSPVYSVYDHWWSDPATGRESKVRWRLYIFFTPVDGEETALTTFVYIKSSYPGPAGGARLMLWKVRSLMDHEIRLDVRILEGLADKSAPIEGMKLSRFDRILGMNRERIDRVYRGGERPVLGGPHVFQSRAGREQCAES